MIHDVAIIGGGPVGIFSVFANGMQSLSCVLIDAFDQLGGQCMCLYPEKYIYDIPAFPKITGKELIENLKTQAFAFKPTIELNSFVMNVTKKDEIFELEVQNTCDASEKKIVKARSIMVALGSGIFKPLKLPLLEAQKFENSNILYFLNDLSIFQDKCVTIAGGGDSAVDWALMLSDVASCVYLVHRREYIKAHPSSWEQIQQKAADGKIVIKIPYAISQINEVDGKFTGISIKNESQEEFLKCDYLLPCFGLKSDLEFVNKWNLDLEKGRISVDQSTMSTSYRGIYALGDCVEYPGKRKLIVTGFSEAMQAAVNIRSFLYPDRAPVIGHSTTVGIPQLG